MSSPTSEAAERAFYRKLEQRRLNRRNSSILIANYHHEEGVMSIFFDTDTNDYWVQCRKYPDPNNRGANLSEVGPKLRTHNHKRIHG